MTVSPAPSPRRSTTTTTFFVGSWSRSYGCTIRKRTPSRSGDFLVDQTVPITLPKNMFQVPGNLKLTTLALPQKLAEAAVPADVRKRCAPPARTPTNTRPAPEESAEPTPSP